MSTELDEAWASDRATLLLLAEKTIRHSVPILEAEMHAVFEDVAKCLRWTAENRAGVFLQCTVDGKIVGMILVKQFWNLCCLFVDPTFHGSGIGKALVVEAVRRCVENAEHFHVRVNSSPNAVGFYQAMGFVLNEGQTPKGSSVPMILPLQQHAALP